MTTTRHFCPSPQQADFLEWVSRGKGSALVPAVAGAGKTTVLVEALSRMNGSVAFCAYNKKIAEEIKARIPADAKGVRAGTFHSFGMGAWLKANGYNKKIEVNGKKIQVVNEELKVPEQYRGFVTQVVSLAKQRALGVLCSAEDWAAWQAIVDHFELDELLLKEGVGEYQLDDEAQLALGWSKKVLRRSIELDTTVIDFDDMIYAPLIHNTRMWQNDWVLIDEAQDSNPARRALAKKMLKAGGRLVAVGDPYQAIYGFTGADNDAMDVIKAEFSCQTLPLTVTYRCPKAVVALARTWVSHIEAHPSAPEGCVRTLTHKEFQALPETALRAQDAILCRLTKPLVEIAYSLIRRGIACHVEGKEIGRGLLALATKWKVTSLDVLGKRLEKYQEREVARFLSKGQETKAEALADRVETLRVIMGTLKAGSKVEDLRQAIERLFGDTEAGQPSPNLTLSTVHKSKGREWDRVYLYGRTSYMPSRYARQEWQLRQEYNLMYVAVTRAKAELIEVTAEDKQEKAA